MEEQEQEERSRRTDALRHVEGFADDSAQPAALAHCPPLIVPEEGGQEIPDASVARNAEFLIASDSAAQPVRRPPGKRQERFPELVTLREDRFAMLVALGHPFRRAHELAGFEGSAASHRANGCRLAAKPNVAARIRELAASRRDRLEAAGEEELELAGDVMRFTVLDLFDEFGKAIKIQDLPRHAAVAIKSIRPTKYGTALEFRDTLRAAEVRLRAFGRLKEAASGRGFTLEDLVAGMAEQSLAGNHVARHTGVAGVAEQSLTGNPVARNRGDDDEPS